MHYLWGLVTAKTVYQDRPRSIKIAVKSKIELFWERLCERLPHYNVAAWKKQPKEVQEAFVEGVNIYGNLKIDHLASTAFLMMSVKQVHSV
jgi:hypothetical protein